MEESSAADHGSVQVDLGRAQARLATAVQQLEEARDLAEIQAIVRRATREMVGADGATFVLKEAEHCYYADEDAIGPLWKGRRFPMQVCISGWAMINKRAAIVPNIYHDARIPLDAYRTTFVKSLAVVPIGLDAPIGAVGSYWSYQHTASSEEVQLLQGLANATARAMQSRREWDAKAAASAG